MRTTTSWHAKYGKDDDDDDFCEDWHDEVENWAYIYEYKILHLNCVNFFWSSKKWFGLVKVLPLLDQMTSEVQDTFGMTVIFENFGESLLKMVSTWLI
jgi:hypothetical protein